MKSQDEGQYSLLGRAERLNKLLININGLTTDVISTLTMTPMADEPEQSTPYEDTIEGQINSAIYKAEYAETVLQNLRTFLSAHPR